MALKDLIACANAGCHQLRRNTQGQDEGEEVSRGNEGILYTNVEMSFRIHFLDRMPLSRRPQSFRKRARSMAFRELLIYDQILVFCHINKHVNSNLG